MTDEAHPGADRTRRSYDAVAEQYAHQIGHELAGKPVDRALYALFAELVGTDGIVADVGCGPGHVADHLVSLGLSVLGVDASPSMIAVARRRYPRPRFEVGAPSQPCLPTTARGRVPSPRIRSSIWTVPSAVPPPSSWPGRSGPADGYWSPFMSTMLRTPRARWLT